MRNILVSIKTMIKVTQKAKFWKSIKLAIIITTKIMMMIRRITLNTVA